MTATNLIVILALGTLAGGSIYALREKWKTEERKNDPDAPKSTLAADAPSKTPDGRGQP
ncbi:hypothetical protein SAMN05444722_1468 [Rhodovulum sp. ES.010]|uniref:hypothetical protein n=1 Tax=Rhodovulum sp. ES.010 TaxID=1882821 RepID=UPI000926384B|nr:hypothetical protein [Rhodovulum sp. ES.010]SIO32932.1 hypothetical protein SAMN05444722_1468 [Rhodovulum sp. ES.010]